MKSKQINNMQISHDGGDQLILQHEGSRNLQFLTLDLDDGDFIIVLEVKKREDDIGKETLIAHTYFGHTFYLYVANGNLKILKSKLDIPKTL